ncbi:hypothetical protein ACIOD1_17940 [Streptomyces sp. NPDC088097]|uniref:hypothetical protein n=1 Tax=Streptomyces sp. NPDC088097 TaxID=3365823 RepID=UPI0037FE8EA1
MPIDPYAALNAMLRAEASRFSPPAPPATRPDRTAAPTAAAAAEADPARETPQGQGDSAA